MSAAGDNVSVKDNRVEENELKAGEKRTVMRECVGGNEKETSECDRING